MKTSSRLVIILILAFVTFRLSLYADDDTVGISDFVLSEDGKVYANYEENTLTVSGSGKIVIGNWVELKKLLIDSSFWSESSSTIKFEKQGEGKNIFLPANCSNFFQEFKGNIYFADAIDSSEVEDMGYMFQGATNFNQNINSWDVSNVKSMAHIFREAISFNQPLNNWNTEKVASMNHMFDGAKKFNQNINSWNMKKVSNTTGMFMGATSFNQPLNNWELNNLQWANNMFQGATNFNQDINNFNVSKVKSLSNIFDGATSFNGDIGSWDTSNATNMYRMFAGASSFNANISDWKTSNVTNMVQMFLNAKKFNRDLHWNTSKVTNMSGMFAEANAFNGDISGFDMSRVNNSNYMLFKCYKFNKDLSKWDVSSVEDMSYMFYGAHLFNSDLSGWDTSKVTNMRQMFLSARGLEELNLLNRKDIKYTDAMSITSGNNNLDIFKFKGMGSFVPFKEQRGSDKLLKDIHIRNITSGEVFDKKAGETFVTKPNDEYHIYSKDYLDRVRVSLSFVIKDKDDGSRINDVNIVLTSDGNTIKPIDNLKYEVHFFKNYDYEISKDGYVVQTGSVSVKDSDKIVEINLIKSVTDNTSEDINDKMLKSKKITSKKENNEDGISVSTTTVSQTTTTQASEKSTKSITKASQVNTTTESVATTTKSYGDDIVVVKSISTDDKHLRDDDIMYRDIKNNEWYSKAVKCVTKNNIMGQTKEDKFEPFANVTRGDMTKMLYNMKGNFGSIDIRKRYKDVGHSSEYEREINWATYENIVVGFPNGTFKPNMNITREQVITMIYRYFKEYGKYFDMISELNKFEDREEVSKYALKPMLWAVENGVIKGTSYTKLSPKKDITRAEVATIIKRLLKIMK